MKVREVMQNNDPFLKAEDELVNIVTNAIMPEQVKQARNSLIEMK